jgi:drug/metabolite transporter (DMT)-like permease
VAAVVTLALVAALAGVVVALRDRAPGRLTVGLAALAAVVTLVQSAVAAVELVQGRRPPEPATFVGYLLGIVVVLPVAIAWAVTERTRWSGVVVAVGGFTVAVMTARLTLLWRGSGG